MTPETQQLDSVLQIRLPKAVRDDFKAALEEDGLKISEVLRGYIDCYLVVRKTMGRPALRYLKGA